MNIQEAHYAFKLGKDRIDTLSTQDFNKAEIDWLLHEAQMVFVKTRSGGSNAKATGFENTSKRIDDLSTIVIKYPLQPAIIPTLVGDRYEVKLSNLAHTYYQLISAWAEIVIDDDCTQNVGLKFAQHDDYNEALSNPFNSPSREFLLYNMGRSTAGSSTSIYIYPGDYLVNKVYLEYIKQPSKVSYGNYVYIDGVTYPPTSFELPEHTHQEIIDIACQIAALNIESPEYIQLKTQKVFMHE